MNIDVIKDANAIEDVIGETYPLRGDRRRYMRGVEHDSLVVDVQKQYYVWNSMGHGGDVLTWLEKVKGLDFRGACEFLCRRAGLPLQWSGQDMAVLQAARARHDVLTVVADYLSGRLWATASATEWAFKRGWSKETLEQARVGFWDGNRRGLVDHLRMHEFDVELDVVKAVLKMPSGLFVYAHFVGNRCHYLSGRGIGEKFHYNLEVELAGAKQPYFNHVWHGKAGHVVVVEGQADALSLAQWGIAAVGMAGLYDTPGLIDKLKGYDQVYVALDGDAAGKKVVTQIAEGLGPLTRVVLWPDHLLRDGESMVTGIKDANDFLKAGGSRSDVRELLGASPIYAEFLAQLAAAADPMDYADARRRAVAAMAALPDYVFAERRKALAVALDVNLTTLNHMVRALQKEAKNSKAAHKTEEIQANGFVEGHLFEMVYDGKHENGPRSGLAVRYPDGRIAVVAALETDSYRILPFSPFESLLRQNIVRLPSNVEPYESDMALQQRIQGFIHKYVDLPGQIEVLASYYVMMTWLFDAFYVVPYLRARGNSDSGKSRFTEVIGEMCMRSIFVTGSTTPSPVFRTMEKWHGMTLIMDEADLPHTDTSADWVQMFNTGYKKGFSILRTAMRDGEAVVEGFNAFGPKVLNMRGKFVDDATESRCLTWDATVGRGIRSDIPRYITDREGYYAEALQIRNQLLMFRLRNWEQVEIDYNHAALRDMPGRLVEITVPLMSITKEQSFKDAIMDFVKAMNYQAIMERSTTLNAKVLEGILRAYYLPDAKVLELTEGLQEKLRLQVAHITRQTNRLIDSENAEAGEEGDDDKFRPRKLSAGKVGRVINVELNLKTEKATVGNRPMCLIWDIDRMNALIIRYGLEELVLELIEKAEKRKEKMGKI